MSKYVLSWNSPMINKELKVMLALLVIVFGVGLLYNYNEQVVARPGWVIGKAYDQGKYYVIVEFNLDNKRDLIRIDEHAYYSIEAGEVYGFECKYNGINIDDKYVPRCTLYEEE